MKLLHDASVLIGLAAATYGAWLAWPPLGWLAGGVLLAAWGIWSAAERLRGKDKSQ